jgi:hypothetical protein
VACGSSATAEDSNPSLRLTNGNGRRLSSLSHMDAKPYRPNSGRSGRGVCRMLVWKKLYVFEIGCS